MQYYNEYYAIIAFKTHAIALAYKRYSNNHYKFTLFDSNSELAEFSNIESIKDALIKTMGSYTLNKADGKEYFIIDEYKKILQRNIVVYGIKVKSSYIKVLLKI